VNPVDEGPPLNATTATPDPQVHPVSPAVRKDVEAQLMAIESEHGVRVLYACESGSRGWGFASPDSDYDVRFIYVAPLSSYLSVTPQRDVIELPISDELDINGWDLRKALGLLKRGNATLIEWLDSPVVYRADTTFLEDIRRVARDTHQAERSFLHYLHMAKKNYRDYLRGDMVRLKKYLYVLRPLLAALWIEQVRGIAPMPFQQLVDAIVTDHDVRLAIDELLVIKRAAMESEQARPMPAINAFVERELARLSALAPMPTQDTDFTALDTLLLNMVLRCDPQTSTGLHML
jgi:predicted nucleotidyltransferase